MGERYTPDAVARLAQGRGGECFLQTQHVQAAQRLAELFERARLHQRVTMSYDPSRISDGAARGTQADHSDFVADARAKLNRLAKTVPLDCWSVLIDVCCFDRGLPEVEMSRQWPRRGAKLVLRIGLDQLAVQWGLAPEAVGQAGLVQSWLPERMPMFLD